jgi:hypothetical protein
VAAPEDKPGFKQNNTFKAAMGRGKYYFLRHKQAVLVENRPSSDEQAACEVG